MAVSEKISLDRVDELLRAVLTHLKNAGGRDRPKAILAAIAPGLHLTKYELERTKTGAVRWETNVRFYSINCVKAGYMQRDAGYWTLTKEGEKALSLPKGQVVRTAGEKYKAWKSAQPIDTGGDAVVTEGEKTVVEGDAERLALYEEAVETARAAIEDHINRIDPFDFQHLVAELLRAMGYHVASVADAGPDGGVDVVAYRDPLGTIAPRLKVQVKHRDKKVDAKDVRELEGVLRKDGDIGLIVSSGGFTSEAVREIRSSTKHIETMDLDRLITLWQEHYTKLSEKGRGMLPLAIVHFLAPRDE